MSPAFLSLYPVSKFQTSTSPQKSPSIKPTVRTPKATLSRRAVAPVPSSPALGTVPIRVCFCDIDGTMLRSDNAIVPENVAAVKALPYPDVRWIPATGKSRAGCVASLGDELEGFLKERYPGGMPGVFLQGLVCYGEDGKLIHENTLPATVCQEVVELARDLDLDLLAYARDGDSILCEKSNPTLARVVDFHEPVPEEIGKWENVIGEVPIMKFLFMASEERVGEARPAIEGALNGHAEITKATEGMLEVLPQGASKAAGVTLLRKRLGIRAEECLAIGDGENDEGMLREAGVSVAVANAVPLAAAAAKFQTVSNDEGGVGKALERFVMRRW